MEPRPQRSRPPVGAWLVLSLSLVGCAYSGQPEPVGTAGASTLSARYLGNEGFLLESGGRRVLIDALFGDGIAGYQTVPPTLREQLESGTGDWAGIDLALATHFHGDHFDPGAVTRFLVANPTARFVSTPQAIERLAASAPSPDVLARARGVLPGTGEIVSLDFDSLQVDVLNLHHGHRDPPVENLGFVVTLESERFLHFGDTEAKLEDFEPYLDLLADTDLALLPFWFLSSEWRATMVRDRIRPRRVVAAHLPEPTAPAGYFARWGSYDNLLAVIRDAFPAAELAIRPGEPLD